MNTICVFGDSTAWGAWDLEKGGWVSRLWLYIGRRDDQHYLELYNLSVSGGTSKMILDRFESEAKYRWDADGLIFQTGGNDAAINNDTGRSMVELDEFKQNIRELIKRAQKKTKNIMFVSLKNCDESKTNPVSWTNITYLNHNLSIYNAAMKEVCREYGVLFLQLSDLDNNDFYDGLHPNAKGHEKLFLQVRDFLKDHDWL
jgi:lysophospholipase L1-like esterase